jgi:hypothetical protein
MKQWAHLEEIDLDSVNSDLVLGEPTADVAIYYPSNLDEAHAERVNVDLLMLGFSKSKEAFAEAGVQLRLVGFNSGWLDPRLFSVDSTLPGSEKPSSRFTNMYVGAERQPAMISSQAEEAFSAMVKDDALADRTIHLVVLQTVFMSFYEQLDHRTWQMKTIFTGGLSFPGYMYGASMPRHLRGVISITDLNKDENSWKTVAHELGHKLLNVSHEYRDVAPQHEVRADGGLMLYGKGTEIASGPEGRYHLERLHKSPYLYRETELGEREWNPDYEAGGFYYDPIYTGISMEIEPS